MRRAAQLGGLVVGLWLAARTVARARRWSAHGKVIVVSGGSRGLGLLIAETCARHGAQVVVAARDAAELERACARIAELGPVPLGVVCDVQDPHACERLVASAIDAFGRIDALVNVAGTIQVGPLEAMTSSDFDHALRTHLWGPLHLVLACLPHMRARKRGRIVNVSSIGGLIGVPHLLPYAASKFALTGLSEGLHAELAREGIVVTTVCPGLMRTGSPRHAWFKGDHAAEYRWFAAADSLPLLSMSAERAAARIFDALSAGEAFVILGLPAKLAARVHGIAPGLVDRALALANRWLPRPTIAGLEARAGAECAPDAPGPLFRAIVAPSVRAEGRLNER